MFGSSFRQGLGDLRGALLEDDAASDCSEVLDVDTRRARESVMVDARTQLAEVEQRRAHLAAHHWIYQRWAEMTSKAPHCEAQGFVTHPTGQTALSGTGLHFGWGAWVAVAAIGLVTGIVAVLVDIGLERLFDIRMQANDHVAERVPPGLQGAVLQWFQFSGVAMLLASVAGCLACFAAPLASGSGIPEIKCYLNGITLNRVVSPMTLLAKAVGIVFSVSAGLPCGKEGPMIHSGAVIGGLMSRGYTKLRNSLRKDQPLNGQNERRDFVAAGATAGVSAAFGAPMGACLFAIEEGTSHMSPRILMKLFGAAGCAALVCRLFRNISDFACGKEMSGILGSTVPVFFERFQNGMQYAHWELVLFACIGVLGGVIGGIFCRVNKALTKKRKVWMPAAKVREHGWLAGTVIIRRGDILRFLEVLFVTLVVSSIQFWLPIIANGVQPMVREELTLTEQLFWNSGTTSLKKLLHQPEPFDMHLLAVFFVVQITTTCWTYGIGVPSGLFVPSLLAGAALGRFFGQCMQQYGSAAGPGIYALIGATALLAGKARITISLAMILMETTGESSFSLPIFLVVLVARWIGDLFGRGIYDMHIIDLKRIPLLETDPEDCMIDMQAKEVMGRDIVSLQEVEEVGELHEKLTTCGHNGFPVLRDGRIVGLVPREMLTFLLNNAESYGILDEDDRKIIPYGKFCRQTSLVSPGLRSIKHFQRVLDKRIDLTPYMSRCYHTMSESATVYVCYQLFRGQGLRWLYIVSEDDGRVCGVITRKDLILIEDEGEDCVELAEKTPEPTTLQRAITAAPGLGGMGGM